MPSPSDPDLPADTGRGSRLPGDPPPDTRLRVRAVPEVAADEVLLAAVASTPDALIVFRPDGTIVLANDAVPSVFGWAPEELIGRNMGEIIHADELAVAIASERDLATRGQITRTPGLMRFVRPDGSPVLVQMAGNPFAVADGTELRSVFGRRADDLTFLREGMERLVALDDLDELMRRLPDQLTWRPDSPHVVLVWRSTGGRRMASPTPLPPELVGLDDALAPWHAAWRGRGGSGLVDDLPADAAAVAHELGLVAYTVEPIVGEDGSVQALLSLWQHGTSLPLPMYSNLTATITRLATVTVQFLGRQEQLVHLADHDALTGLLNRRVFHATVAEAAEVEADAHDADIVGDGVSASPDGVTTPARRVAIVVVDLDGFKPVNDERGHAAGDAVLVEIASRLRAACRPGDLVARLGGDEFAVLAPSTSVDAVLPLLDALVAEAGRPVRSAGEDVVVGASIGCAWGRPGPGLLAAADAAMYEAKRAGGNRWTLAPAGAPQV